LSLAGSLRWNPGAPPASSCSGCCHRPSARIAGGWPSRPGMTIRGRCSGCCVPAVWDADAVRDDLRAFMATQLGHAGAVLIPDETGFLKGTQGSVGCSANTAAPPGGLRTPSLGAPQLCLPARPGADRPAGLPAGIMDRGPVPLRSSRCSCRGGVRDQARTADRGLPDTRAIQVLPAPPAQLTSIVGTRDTRRSARRFWPPACLKCHAAIAGVC
jgi:hypothetical protein